MSKSKKIQLTIDLLIVAVLFTFDQWTKYLAVERLKGKDAFVLIRDVLELDYLENRGAAFGILQDQKIMLIAVGIVFVFVIGVLLFRTPDCKKYVPIHILASVIAAGGIGNMADRIRLEYVIDFISFVLIDYPIFNVADIYVVLSTIVLFALFLFVYKEDDLNFIGSRKKK